MLGIGFAARQGATEEVDRRQTLEWVRVVQRRAEIAARERFIGTAWSARLQSAITWPGSIAVDIGSLREVRRAYGDCGAAFILFHEVGHTLDQRPILTTTSWEKEIWADAIAGMLLASLGFGIQGAVRFLSQEGRCTRCMLPHPPPVFRIVALEQSHARGTALFSSLAGRPRARLDGGCQ